MNFKRKLFSLYITFPLWRILTVIFFYLVSLNNFYSYYNGNIVIRVLNGLFTLLTSLFFILTIITTNSSTEEEKNDFLKRKENHENDIYYMSKSVVKTELEKNFPFFTQLINRDQIENSQKENNKNNIIDDNNININNNESNNNDDQNNSHDDNNKNDNIDINNKYNKNINKIDDHDNNSDTINNNNDVDNIDNSDKVNKKNTDNLDIEELTEDDYKNIYLKCLLLSDDKYIKYCYFCKNYIYRWDHHCPIMGTSIGAKNHIYFALMMLCFDFMIIFGFIHKISLLKYIFNIIAPYYTDPFNRIIILLDIMKNFHLTELISFILYIPIILLLTNFLLFHIRLILSRDTTYVFLKTNQWKKMSFENLRKSFNERGKIDLYKIKKLIPEISTFILLLSITLYNKINNINIEQK